MSKDNISGQKEIQESLNYIVKNMVTKDEHNELKERFDGLETNQIIMQQDIKELQANTREIRNTVDNAFGKLDGFLKKMDTETMERTALHHKVDRHDIWIQDIAQKTDTVLS